MDARGLPWAARIHRPSPWSETMAYEQIEQISTRKGEKIAAFLTIENAAGLAVTVLPIYMLSGALPLLLRALLLGAAAALGIGATLEVRGLALYERALWRGRGALRLRLQGCRITPEQLAGASRSVRPDRPLALAGPIQVAGRQQGLLGRLNGRRVAVLVQPPTQAAHVGLRLPINGHGATRPGSADDHVAAE